MLEQQTHELFATRNGILLMSDFIKMTHVLIKCTISSLFTVCAFSSTSFLCPGCVVSISEAEEGENTVFFVVVTAYA